MRAVQIDGPMIWARMEFEEWPPDKMEVRCKSTALWDALDGIFLTLNDAVRRYPDDTWPTDVVRMVAIMAEEAGEAIQAANDVVYKGKSVGLLRNELMQTAAMCFRCLAHMDIREASE